MVLEIAAILMEYDTLTHLLRESQELTFQCLMRPLSNAALPQLENVAAVIC